MMILHILINHYISK